MNWDTLILGTSMMIMALCLVMVVSIVIDSHCNIHEPTIFIMKWICG
jgi:hypothetical protein